ncbi:unnamed protein product [Gadus morhua 'NCC']
MIEPTTLQGRRRLTKGAVVPIYAPAPTALHEIEMLKVKLEAEREKVNLKEEMIDVLKKDEIYLQGELTKKDAYYQEQLAKKDANFNDELARKDAILLDKMKNKKIRKQAVRNTKGVILRYVAALEAFRRGKSMKAAFDAVGVDRNTVARTAIVAELHLAAPEVFESISWNER